MDDCRNVLNLLQKLCINDMNSVYSDAYGLEAASEQLTGHSGLTSKAERFQGLHLRLEDQIANLFKVSVFIK